MNSKDADMIVKGRLILTMDNERSLIENGAIAVKGGLIEEVGSAVVISGKYRAKKSIDAKNSLVMPGFINTHTHSAMAYFRGLADDLPLDVWLKNHIWPAEAEYVNERFVKKASELACLEMLMSGVTAFSDMYFFEKETARAAKKAGIRAAVGECIIDFPSPSAKKPAKALSLTRELAREYEKDELIKVFVCPHSVYACSNSLLLKADELAREFGLPLHTHIAETKSEFDDIKKKYKKTPVRLIEDLGLLKNRVIAVHSVWVSAEDIELLAAREAAVSHNPVSNMKLASGVMPIKDILMKKRIAAGLGTDGAASNNTLDLFSEMRACALLHKSSSGDPAFISAPQIVEMATVSAARAIGMEKSLGSLSAGKKADIITLNLDMPHLNPLYDPYSHLVYSAYPSDVENVIINGRIIMEKRELKTMDKEKIINEAKAFKIL